MQADTCRRSYKALYIQTSAHIRFARLVSGQAMPNFSMVVRYLNPANGVTDVCNINAAKGKGFLQGCSQTSSNFNMQSYSYSGTGAPPGLMGISSFPTMPNISFPKVAFPRITISF